MTFYIPRNLISRLIKVILPFKFYYALFGNDSCYLLPVVCCLLCFLLGFVQQLFDLDKRLHARRQQHVVRVQMSSNADPNIEVL